MRMLSEIMKSSLKKIKLPVFIILYSAALLLTLPQNAYAMHIMEGFLPVNWAGFWFVLTIPFLILGLRSIQKTVTAAPSVKMLLGLAGAFAFVLSALKIPSVTGSCSHPTGVGLGAIMFGPLAMVVLGCIVLIFQALLLAHGGVTTLGANTFSMAVVGPIAAFGLPGSQENRRPWLAGSVSGGCCRQHAYIYNNISSAGPGVSPAERGFCGCPGKIPGRICGDPASSGHNGRNSDSSGFQCADYLQQAGTSGIICYY